MINDKSDDLITRFLLGELSEEERAQVEERFLSDNDFFEEVLSAEDALIDQYILGQLSGDRRERAESLFRSSRRQRSEVEFTEGLISSLREVEPEGKPTPAVRTTALAGSVGQGDAETSRDTFSFITSGLRSLFPRLALLTVSLLCLSLLAWVLYHYSQKRGPEEERITDGRSNQEPRQERSEENRNEAESGSQAVNEKESQEKVKDLTAQVPARKPRRMSSILLAPTAPERGGDARTPIFKIEARRVRLQLALDDSWRYSRFSVLITTFDGRRIWSKDSLAASQIKRGRLTLLLPSSLFGYEDYRIELKGLSDDGDFIHVADYILKIRK